MFRRTFLGLGLMLLGFSRRAWAQLANASPRYARLSRPVRIPLAVVATAWQPALFTAEAMTPPTAAAAARRVLISGVLFRKGDEHLSALCLTCPHEQCKVDLISDPIRLAGMTGGAAMHPLFECGCHSSVFDAGQEGARLSGETPRGLYRFRISSVSDGVVEINEVEEVALFEV